MKPNLFIIGAPKCGTTALGRYLAGHPKIFIHPRITEPEYFNFDYSARTQMSLKTYLALFEKADPARHQVAAECSVSYLISRVAVTEILKFNPEAKFIVMLRNPVDLVYARHSEFFYQGVENVSDFETAWRLEESRKRGEKLPFRCFEPKKLFYSDWGKLGAQVEALFASAPRERVKVILLEDMAADTRGVYEEVLEFIALPSDGRQDFPRFNENKKVLWAPLQTFYRVLGTYLHDLKSKLGVTGGMGIIFRLRELNRKVEKREPMREELRRELNDFYRDDVRKLSGLLGRDLSRWVESL